MNLVEQMFEQQHSGSAQGQGLGQFFAEGIQLGQNQQRINQAQQQLAMELAQAPLKQTLMQQDAAYKAAQTEQLLRSNQILVGTEQSLAGLAGIVSKAWTEASPEDSIPLFYDAVAKNPKLRENPGFQQLWQDNQAAIQAKALANHYESMSKHYEQEDAINLAKATAEKDKNIREANEISDLTIQLRESQAKTLEPDEGNPEYRAELTKQEGLKARLAKLQGNQGGIVPVMQVFDGKKFLFNPKTGAMHEIKSVIGKREFIAQHIGTWMRDNPGMTQDEAAEKMNAFYDQYLSEGSSSGTSAPGAPLPTTPTAAPTYRYNPTSGRIEPVKP